MNQHINELVKQWINIAERDLLDAKQGFAAEKILTDSISFHCQQAGEKYLKAFLAYHQIDFPKTHSMSTLVNLCISVDTSFNAILDEADFLTDYAVEVRYPDDWYEPALDEAKNAYDIAIKIRNFVLSKIKF